jgi:hypothetical protein
VHLASLSGQLRDSPSSHCTTWPGSDPILSGEDVATKSQVTTLGMGRTRASRHTTGYRTRRINTRSSCSKFTPVADQPASWIARATALASYDHQWAGCFRHDGGRAGR